MLGESSQEKYQQANQGGSAGQAGKSLSKYEKKERLYQKSLLLIQERLERFLSKGGKIEGYEVISDCVGLSEDQAKKFLDYMELFLRFPYLERTKDPREIVYNGNDGRPFNAEYFAENTLYIWDKNNKLAEFE